MAEHNAKPSDERPYFDRETATHYIELPAAAFDAVSQPMSILQTGLFADMVCGGEWVWVECEEDDRAVLLQVTGIAAVCSPRHEDETEGSEGRGL